MFVTIDETASAHPCHPKSIVCIMIHSRLYTLYESGQMLMTYIHRCDVIQDIFTALKVFCALHTHLQPPATIGNHSVFNLI